MDTEEVQQRVVRSIIDHMQINSDSSIVVGSSKLGDDIGMDSLDLIELELDLEESFNVCFEDWLSFNKNTTVSEVAAAVIDRLDRGEQ